MDANIEKQLIRIIRSLCHEMPPEPTGADEKRHVLDGIKVVLLDVYGTLFVSGSGDIGVASQRSSGAAMREALVAAGVSSERKDRAGERASERFLQEIQRTHHELRNRGVEYPEVDIRETWRAVLDTLRREGLAHGEISDDLIMRLAVEYECRTNPVWPMPELPQVLQTLCEKKIRLGIVSNAQFYTPLLFPALCNAVIGDLGFSADLCVWSYILCEAKPSVRLFEKSLDVVKRNSGIPPSSVAYVGNDMLNDILPAATVGCRTVLFAGDRRSLRLREGEPQCAGIAPDAIITDLRQLPGILV